MGNGQTKRYIGGKRPLKYYNEDVWPVHEYNFKKLGIDQSKGFELFMAFSKVDADQSGKVSVKECMSFFGGKVSKYTERVFDVLDIGERDGLEFHEFVYALWNFCTMYTILLARHMFEIFDPDHTGLLEKPDIETLYRMLYDSDYFDPKLVDPFPFDEAGKISVDKFIAHIKSNRNFIKPVTTYQGRVRKALGGFIMWETLTTFRKRTFAEIDETSASLDEAVERILNSEYLDRLEVKEEYEEIDRRERDRILRRAEELKEELRQRQEEMELEKRRRQNQLDDENVKLSWMSFEAVLTAFEEEVFTKNQTWCRKERRDEVFAAFDRAREVTESYWSHKYEHEYRLVDPEGGMPLSEKEHRLSDLLATQEGQKEQQRIETLTLLDLIRTRLSKRLSEEDPMMKSISGITANLIANLNTLDAATQFANQLSKWGETKRAKQGLHDKMLELVMNNAINAVKDRQHAETEERYKQYKRKEFDIITRHGARETRWETVYDARKRKHVTINVDTLQILEDKFCICEQCDATIDPADLKCYSCGSARSVKNMKFYRALGT